MPEITARGDRNDASGSADARQPDTKQRTVDSSRETTNRSSAKRNTNNVLPGVRTVSSPPGEPYNDPEYGRT